MPNTNNRFQRHWGEAKVFIKKNWPKFTDVELKRVNGDFDRFFEYFNEYYDSFPLGEAKARDQFLHFFNEMDERYPDRV